MINKKISRRTAARNLAAGTIAAGGLLSAGAVTAATGLPSFGNVDKEILALSEKIQNSLIVRQQANIALGEWRIFEDGQGYTRDHHAERKALDTQIKQDIVSLREMKPTSDEAMQKRYLAFNSAYFTVWQTLV